MKTKDLLIQSAIEVLNQDPSTKLDAIAEKAQVSRRTLHRYFNSRDHMIKVCGESIIGGMLKDVQMAIEMNKAPIDQLRYMFNDDIEKGQYFEFCQKFSTHFEEAELQSQFKEMGILFYSVLDQLKSNGAIDVQLSNEWLSYVWMGMVRSANQALNDGAIAPKKVNELAWAAFSNGMIIQNKTKKK